MNNTFVDAVSYSRIIPS